MTLRTARNMTRKFLRNRRGTAEVIGSILFIVIVIFFFSNVYLWHDQATKQMNTMLSNKMNSPVSITATSGGLNVTNNGGVDVTLSRLWVNDNSGAHIFADLENIGGHQILVTAGSTVTIVLISPTQYLSDGSLKVTWGNPVTINYAPTGTVTFKILTTLGNTASCSYPASGSTASGSSIVADPQSFAYYVLSNGGNPPYTFDPSPSAGSSGYSIGSDHFVVFGITLTNNDPNRREISLSLNSQLFFLNTTNATNSFAFYVVSTDGNQPIRTVLSAYSTISLQYNVPKTVYFASATPKNFIPEIVQSQGGNQRIFTINLALLGIVGSDQFGQNIPFVSVISP
jgi:hypothetical protein